MTSEPSLADLTSRKGWVRGEFNTRIWIPCPSKFPDDPDLDADGWTARMAEDWWEMSGMRYGQDAVSSLAAMIKTICEKAYEMVPCHQVWAWYRDFTLPPLPLHIGIWQMSGERDQQLSALSGATDLDVIRPPKITKFTTEPLGTGFRTLRHKQADRGTVVAMLGFAFRSEEFETDIQITVGTPDLKQLARATPDIETFVRQIEVYYNPAPS